MTGFGDRLTEAVARRESQIVLGLDPDPARLWPAAAERAGEAAAAVLAHCLALVDAAGPACVAVKPQLACFERLGAPGWAALEHVCDYARDQGLLVLADGKRGDVPVTAAVYGEALVERPQGRRVHRQPAARPRRADAADRGGERHGAGAFVLVRTSNPGAADLLDARLETGERLWERLATLVRRARASRASRASPTSARSPAPPSPSISNGCAS